ncbi:hypothetical protein F5B19DRAFT_354382 [Rostrohypoxylon terebratum]|nr:hypothetical protein F5B19DRAFT_354382 [Rostrohypoxylon terebratum]
MITPRPKMLLISFCSLLSSLRHVYITSSSQFREMEIKALEPKRRMRSIRTDYKRMTKEGWAKLIGWKRIARMGCAVLGWGRVLVRIVKSRKCVARMIFIPSLLNYVMLCSV